MRADVAAIAADVERRRKERELAEHKPQLVDHLRESRLLVAMICDEGVLEQCEEVEVNDFDDYRHQEIFALVRRIQHRDGEVSFEQIFDAIDKADVRAHLVMAIAQRRPFLGERCLVETKGRLRALAENRRTL